MRPSKRLVLALAFWSALSSGSVPVLAQADVPAARAANSAENLMSTLGELTIPMLLDMNCPRDGKNKKAFIHALAAKNSAQESVEALVTASIAFMDKTRTRIGHGELQEPEEDASAYRADADNLKRLMSAVAQTGGLDYAKVNIGYKTGSTMERILSDTSFLYIHRVLNSDAGRSEYVSQRVGELTNNQPQPAKEAVAANEALLDKILDEFSIERTEGDAIKAILVKGLLNLRSPDGQPDVTLQKTQDHQNYAEIYRLANKGMPLDRTGTHASTLSPVSQSAHPEKSSELQKLEDAEAERAQVLQDEVAICHCTAR